MGDKVNGTNREPKMLQKPVEKQMIREVLSHG